MGFKKDFCQRAMAAKRGEELELIVTETFPVDPFWGGGIRRTSIDKGQLLKVIDVFKNQLYVKGKVGGDYLLMDLPIAFASGCMEEASEAASNPKMAKKNYVYLVYSCDDGYHRDLERIYVDEIEANTYVAEANKKHEELENRCLKLGYACRACRDKYTVDGKHECVGGFPESHSVDKKEIIGMQAVVPEEKSGWQPIETAPRDGTPFILFCDKRYEVVTIENISGNYYIVNGEGFAICPAIGVAGSVFMPLPEVTK